MVAWAPHLCVHRAVRIHTTVYDRGVGCHAVPWLCCHTCRYRRHGWADRPVQDRRRLACQTSGRLGRWLFLRGLPLVVLQCCRVGCYCACWECSSGTFECQWGPIVKMAEAIVKRVGGYLLLVGLSAARAVGSNRYNSNNSKGFEVYNPYTVGKWG